MSDSIYGSKGDLQAAIEAIAACIDFRLDDEETLKRLRNAQIFNDETTETTLIDFKLANYIAIKRTHAKHLKTRMLRGLSNAEYNLNMIMSHADTSSARVSAARAYLYLNEDVNGMLTGEPGKGAKNPLRETKLVEQGIKSLLKKAMRNTKEEIN